MYREDYGEYAYWCQGVKGEISGKFFINPTNYMCGRAQIELRQKISFRQSMNKWLKSIIT